MHHTMQLAAGALRAGAAALRQQAPAVGGSRRLHRCALTCVAAKQVEVRTYSGVQAMVAACEVSHILLPPEQKGLLPQLRQRIQSGEATLASLAAEHSTCPSRSNGGSIGWVARGQTVPEFEEAAFAAAPGALAICETRFGVHLLQVTAEREAAEVGHMSPAELQESLAARGAGGNEDVQYVDVREEGEARLAKLPHFVLFPLSRFDEWSANIHQRLDKERETVVLCHHGVRSMQASRWLLQQGFTNVRNVTGGIDAYSRVDPGVPQY